MEHCNQHVHARLDVAPVSTLGFQAILMGKVFLQFMVSGGRSRGSIAAEAGCRGWLQKLAAEPGCRSWLQRLAALAGCRAWLQRLAAEAGRRGWLQRLAEEASCTD